MAVQIISEYQRPKMASFNPYADNGGSVVAIAGEDYAVLGSDTRLSTGFSIYTRDQSKLFQLSNTTVLGCSGCWCDTLTLTRVLEARIQEGRFIEQVLAQRKPHRLFPGVPRLDLSDHCGIHVSARSGQPRQMYLHEHHKPMSTPAVAQMLSTMLYYKRFFPYYISNILAGLDEEGKGCVYSYDPIGHCERSMFRAGGSAGALLQPLLDNQIGFKNMENITPEPILLDKAIAILKDVFISAAERDIYTGDSIFINVITKDGVKEEKFNLRRD